jgi:hypothetical protein
MTRLSLSLRLKTKTPPPLWQWGSQNLVIRSEPDCRAAQQQRLGKQQAQVAIHERNLTSPANRVKLFLPFRLRRQGGSVKCHALVAFKRKVAGGVLALIGFLLSPLSWWNDLFVNVPLALAFAWLTSALCGRDSRSGVFQVSLILGYWLTNVLGLVLMHHGARTLVTEKKERFSRRELVKNIGVSLAYTAVVLLLIKAGVLKPIKDYFSEP